MKRLFALPTALILVLATAVLVSGATYEQRKLRSQQMTYQINQFRSPDLRGMYLLAKVADQRNEQRLAEYLATGSAEYPHDINVAINALNRAGICWRSVGEVVGYSNTVPFEEGGPVIADYMADQWYGSSSHRQLLQATRYNRGGGSWSRTSDDDPWAMYFFSYYVMDPC